MGKHTVVVIEGDGIGKEVVPAMRRMVDRVTGNRIAWVEVRAGLECFEETDTPLPPVTVELIRKYGNAIKGPTTTPSVHGFSSVNVQLRRELDLFVGLRPVFSLGLPGTAENMKVTLFRENTEGLYDCSEEPSPDGEGVILTARFTRSAMLRLARAAFLYARENGFDRVTYVDKQNIHKLWGRLYHEAFLEVAAEFPDIHANHRLVDATNMFLSLAPQSWGVIVTENMFGDILADHLAALMGGLGVAPGANINTTVALFEAVHGSWPEAAGKNIANPTALGLSASMLLERMGLIEEGAHLRKTLIRTLRTDRTGDLGGDHTTTSFTKAVLANL